VKLLLLRNDNIGDLVCTTPLIEVLHHAFPEATIDFFGNSYNIDLVRYDPRLSRVWYYEKAKHVASLGKKIGAIIKKVSILLQLRRRAYDKLIIATPVFNKRTMRLARWIAPKVIYRAGSPSDRLTSNDHPVTIDLSKPHVLQVLSYAKALGIETPAPKKMSLFLSEEEQRSLPAQRDLVPGDPSLPIIALQISARRPNQRWSYEQWRTLMALLLPHARLRLLWSPGSSKNLQHPGDDQLAAQLAASFPKNSLLATATPNLRSLMVACSASDLIVGADGGAMHIAAALGGVTVTLFGDIDPIVWQPYSEQGSTIISPSDTLADLPPCEVAKKIVEIVANGLRL
jgi:ADP-heptose:LPS heptosyltransferase